MLGVRFYANKLHPDGFVKCSSFSIFCGGTKPKALWHQPHRKSKQFFPDAQPFCMGGYEQLIQAASSALESNEA
jgi:hypothetical protein